MGRAFWVFRKHDEHHPLSFMDNDELERIAKHSGRIAQTIHNDPNANQWRISIDDVGRKTFKILRHALLGDLHMIDSVGLPIAGELLHAAHALDMPELEEALRPRLTVMMPYK
jgi:hypothetical protein